MKLLLIALAAVIAGILYIARSYRPPACARCRDGQHAELLPEHGVMGTSLCVRCDGCGRFYVIEATSKAVRAIDAADARRDYLPRPERTDA